MRSFFGHHSPYRFAITPQMTKYLFFFSLLILVSCHTTKKTVNLDKLKPLKPAKMLEKLEDAAIHPEWVYAKGQLHFKDRQMSMGLSFASVLRKDSIFVMAVKKLGMVVGKIKITPDSVLILNPLQKSWSGGSLVDMANRFGLPPKFSLIQDLILGNPMIITRQHATGKIEDKKYLYSAYDNHWLNAFWLDPLNGRLTQQRIKDNHSRQQFIQQLSDYKNTDSGTLFSFLRTLELQTTQSGQIDIKITTKKVIWNQPRAIHFSIPPNYSRVD